MPRSVPRIIGLTCLTILLLAGVCVLVLLRFPDGCFRRRAVSDAPATVPATAPATTVATSSATPSGPPRDFMDVVRAHYPDLPTTQPFIVPLDLRYSARLVIDDPVYLDSIGDLWITRADADPTHAVLQRAPQRQTHVVREHVLFVHRRSDDRGVWQPMIVCPKSGGGFELVSRLGRQDLGASQAYQWDRAFTWNESIVVPTDRGVSILRPDRRPLEIHHELVPADQYDPAKCTQPLIVLDRRGLIAWMPWEAGKTGSHGAARFADDKWTKLDESVGWPNRFLHIVPLLDGSVIQLCLNGDSKVKVALASLDPAEVDPSQIAALVAQLADPAAQQRDAAFSQLTRYGTGIWPILERLRADQPPEAQIRIEQLLAAKDQPTLGGMVLQGGSLSVVARSDFGSAVLYAEAGLVVPREDDGSQIMAPAWIAILPGQSIHLLPDDLTAELQNPGARLHIVRGELILDDDIQGPRWWLENHFSAPLLKADEMRFTKVIGVDARGRWLFGVGQHPTPILVVDPTLADPTPRLPVWQHDVSGGSVGWTRDDWPAIKRGGAWALVGTEWRAIDERKERMLTAADLPPAPTTTATAPAEPAILTDPDGTQYFGGIESLRIVRADGSETVWPLPPEATGTPPVHLFRGGEDRLFLFNQAGRVLRIKPTPTDPEPFELEAVFTRRIPNVDQPDRIWQDPAGRIIIAYDGDRLAILFPSGRIPREIAQKMTAKDLADAEQ